jgi:hypothetical protein
LLKFIDMIKNITIQVLLCIVAGANIIVAILDIVDNRIQHGITSLVLAGVFILLALQRRTNYKHTKVIKRAAAVLLGIALVNVIYMILK